MSESVRAFVAVRIPVTTPLRDILNELASMGRAVKPIAAENLHITLKFLGETDTSWIDRTCELLDNVASQVTAFDITLQGLGAFPKPSRPSVVWTGIIPPETISKLAAAVEQKLSTFGFASETRPFHPHVTLARVKARPPQGLTAFIDHAPKAKYAEFRVNEVTLIQSVLSSQGPTYTTLHTASLVEGKSRHSMMPNVSKSP